MYLHAVTRLSFVVYTAIWLLYGAVLTIVQHDVNHCVRQVWNAEDTEDEVLAMVVRTGLNSCMGNMIRQLLAPSWQYVEKDPFITVLMLALYLQLVL